MHNLSLRVSVVLLFWHLPPWNSHLIWVCGMCGQKFALSFSLVTCLASRTATASNVNGDKTKPRKQAGELVGGRVSAYFIKTHDLAPVTKLSLVFVFGVSCWLTLVEFHYLFSYQSVRIRSPAKNPTDTTQTQKIINYAPLFKATNIAVHMAYDYFSCFFAQHNINSC